MRPLTSRQREVLALIRTHIDQTGFPPTRAELASAMGFRSANAAEDHLKALARKGIIELCASTSRGIRLLAAAEAELPLRDTTTRSAAAAARADTVDGAGHEDAAHTAGPAAPGLPLVGRVAAGQPILAESHIEASYRLDATLFEQAPDYLLRIRGESMRDAGMLDGDLLAVKATPEAHNGQIVVARIGNEVTVKRLRHDRTGHTIELLPENPDFDPIVLHPGTDEFQIEGIAVGLIRQGKLARH
ncbi:MAG: transcriptional repressor LexA [Lautropia sp.]|nr:transcriptional repressor LexA [Lautropia sp.]